MIGVPRLPDKLHTDKASAKDGLRGARLRCTTVPQRRVRRRHGRADGRIQPRRLVHNTQPESCHLGDDACAGKRSVAGPAIGGTQAAVGSAVGNDHPAWLHGVRDRHRLHRATDHRLHESQWRRSGKHRTLKSVSSVAKSDRLLRG